MIYFTIRDKNNNKLTINFKTFCQLARDRRLSVCKFIDTDNYFICLDIAKDCAIFRDLITSYKDYSKKYDKYSGALSELIGKFYSKEVIYTDI